MRRLLIGGQRPLVAALAQQRIKAIGEMNKLLEEGLVLLFANGRQNKYKKNWPAALPSPLSSTKTRAF